MLTKISCFNAIAVLVIFLRFSELISGVHSIETNKTSLNFTADLGFNLCLKSVRKHNDSAIETICLNEVRLTHESHIVEELIRFLPEYEECVTKMTDKFETVTECCEGYKMVNGMCEARCEKLCQHGECDDANRCSCAIGFGGEWCQKSCPAGNFGSSCEHNCDW